MTHVDLKDTVTIYRVTVAAGAETVTSVETDVPALVKPVSGGESVDLGQAVARQSYRVYLRYRTDLSTRHRLVWASDFGAKTLGILSALDLNSDRRWLELDCVERA